MAQERAYRSEDVVRFLKHLLRHIPGKLLVIWDGSPIYHRATRVYEGASEIQRLVIARAILKSPAGEVSNFV